MSFLEALMKNAGDNRDPEYSVIVRRKGYRSEVSYSGEFRRIEALPRRTWDPDKHFAEWATERLRAPGGSMTLWPVQAQALREIAGQRGGFLPVGVGQGKALISLLAPVVLEAKRPVLFVPAQLREQTLAHVIPRMTVHWKLHPQLRVVGYSELSLEKNKELLDRLRPDLIILDECHRVKNPKAGRTRRLIRWFREHPETLCVAMSGTVSNRSIRDFAHIIRWAMKGMAPIPATWTELVEWADAIDEGIADDMRVGPGALLRFCQGEENARQGFRRRLTETPGVVATREDLIGTSLRIDSFSIGRIPPDVSRIANQMRSTWMTPSGDLITEAVELWRHMREIALGFYYRWDPAPPPDWMSARKEWKKEVRETLKHNQRKLDTELQVWNECAREPNLQADHPWRKWKAIRDSFQPVTVPEWLDDFAIRACVGWLSARTRDDPGIVWTEHRAFGERLSEVSGFPYFGAGDTRIIDCPEPAIIASIQAHSEGKNLQRYSRNLVTAPTASGKAWEQLLGRTHRSGQLADEVVVEIMTHIPELLESFGRALGDARYLEDTFGNQQKLNYADITIGGLNNGSF